MPTREQFFQHACLTRQGSQSLKGKLITAGRAAEGWLSSLCMGGRLIDEGMGVLWTLYIKEEGKTPRSGCLLAIALISITGNRKGRVGDFSSIKTPTI